MVEHDADRREHRGVEKKEASNRSFGILFAVVFTFLALLPLWSSEPISLWALVVAGLFLLVSLVYPRLLQPFKKLWLKLGELMHKIVNPLIMGIMYFGMIVPFGLVARVFRWDPLRTRMDTNSDSWWIERTPPGPASDSLRHQF